MYAPLVVGMRSNCLLVLFYVWAHTISYAIIPHHTASRVSVMDADGPMGVKNDLIGSYSFDAANVYFHKVSAHILMLLIVSYIYTLVLALRLHCLSC